MVSQFNAAPYDDYAPRTPRKKTPKQTQDEHVYSQLLDKPRTQAREQKKRRARIKLQALVEDSPQDVVEQQPPVTFGQYKYRNGSWYAILQEDPEWYVRNCEVRNVPSRSLGEVLRRGGFVTAGEKDKIAAGATSEDPNAPVLQPIAGPTMARDLEPGDNPPQRTRVSSRRKRSPSKRSKKPDPDAQWSPRKRTRRIDRQESMDMFEDGSDIEVARPTQRTSTTDRRREQPLAYPLGLEETSKCATP